MHAPRLGVLRGVVEGVPERDAGRIGGDGEPLAGGGMDWQFAKLKGQ